MDLIDPLDGLLGRILNGPMHKFTFANNAGVCGMDAEALLRRYHIRIWGRDLANPNHVGFLVKTTQARWAEYVMKRAAIPLTSPLFDRSNANVKPGPLPPAWTKGDRPHTFTDFVTTTLDGLLGTGKIRELRINSQMKRPKLKKR